MRLDDILDNIAAYAPDADVDVVIRTYLFAARAHEHDVRKSGEPYLLHPMAAAMILTEMRLDVDTIATALLHDTLEDTLATHEELARLFGQEIADLVEGVTKIGKLRYRSREVATAESFRKMVLAMSEDIRVVLVKLADRLHNMRTLEHMPEHKRRRIAQETFDIYAPIAGRLGLMRMRVEFEDLCFRHLHPERYQELARQVAEGEARRQGTIERICHELKERLASQGIEAELSGRVKHLWSIYRKMVQKKLAFEEVTDLIAFRVMVADVGQCYAALGWIHDAFRPVPDRIKDYIANPKANGYRSLHTTVVDTEGRRFEVQIRTPEMHRVADYGIAAHWRYKEGHLAIRRDELAEITRLRELFETARDVEDPDDFMEAVKIDLFPNDVFVFTPAGDVKELRRGATALDFAYAVHSEVGHHCAGTKVNGRMVRLGFELRSGDTVEVITRRDQHPRRDWLQMVRTGRALSRIRKFLREEERKMGRRMGREMLQAELRRRGSTMEAVVRDGSLKALLAKHGFKEVDELLLELARGQLQATRIARELVPGDDEAEKDEGQQNALERLLARIRKKNAEAPVLIDGEDDVLWTFARCCRPLPGEPVAGFITRGRGITIHRRDCPQLAATDPERRLPVAWGAGARGGRHLGRIRVLCVDRPGLLANISKTCTDSGINITDAEVHAMEDERAECSLQVGVQDAREMRRLIRRIERIKGVIAVDRLGGSKGAGT